MTGKEAVLSVDIGGSKLVTGLVGFDGTVVGREKTTWGKLDAVSVMQTVVDAARRVIGRYKDTFPICAGVNIPGLADPERGYWVEACFSGIRDVPVAQILEDALKMPVYIDNDANNCALAEKMFGVCRDCSDFIWLTVSNGCGAAVFTDNALYRGFYGSAGEIGHICVEETDGTRCGCGNTGCLEAQAAGPGIVRRYRALAGDASDGEIDAAKIAELAAAGDVIASEVFRKEGYYIGKALAAAINTLNPQKAVIGGGVSASFKLFEEELIQTVGNMTYRRASQNCVIEQTGLGLDAALLGAAACAILYSKTTPTLKNTVL